MTTKRLSDLMGCDIFYYHGYTGGLARRPLGEGDARSTKSGGFGLEASKEWDGVADSIYHPFDLGGRRHMEYLAYRGVFADIPFDEVARRSATGYPKMSSAQEAMPLGGDFGAEGALETSRVTIAPRSAGYLALLVALGSFDP